MSPKLNHSTINSYVNDIAILTFLKKNLGLLNGLVLDIGSGRMRYRQTILSAPRVKTYTGLDLEPGKFGYSTNADMFWDGVKIPVVNDSYDSAILFEVLEHCENPNIVIQEAFRILKPGGIMLFSTPFLYQLHGVPYDFQRFTPSGLESLVTKAGFTNTHVSPSGSHDASLGQMIGIWISHRPMPKITRKILTRLFAPVFWVLLRLDQRNTKDEFANGDIMPGILGITYKPQ